MKPFFLIRYLPRRWRGREGPLLTYSGWLYVGAACVTVILVVATGIMRWQ